MTGVVGFNHEAFFESEEELKKLGLIVLNPAILPLGLEHSEYMDICIPMVKCCDTIFMLSGYEGSVGAAMELEQAKDLSMRVIHQNELQKIIEDDLL